MKKLIILQKHALELQVLFKQLQHKSKFCWEFFFEFSVPSEDVIAKKLGQKEFRNSWTWLETFKTLAITSFREKASAATISLQIQN